MNTDFLKIYEQASSDEGLSVIIVGNSTGYGVSCLDSEPAVELIRLASKLRSSNTVLVTHSPFVCRYANNIYQLITNSYYGLPIGKITDDTILSRLKYGNILDAYGTGLFGNVLISNESNEMLNRLAELNVKSMMGLIEDKESEELQELRVKFPTNV